MVASSAASSIVGRADPAKNCRAAVDVDELVRGDACRVEQDFEGAHSRPFGFDEHLAIEALDSMLMYCQSAN